MEESEQPKEMAPRPGAKSVHGPPQVHVAYSFLAVLGGQCLPAEIQQQQIKSKGTEKQRITDGEDTAMELEMASVGRRKKDCREKQKQELRDISKLGQTVLHTSHLLKASLCARPEQQMMFLRMP